MSAILVIGNRQHALVVLMHEGSHHRVASEPWLNDLLSNVLSAYPIFISTFNYRVVHLEHHRSLDTPTDPEGKFYELFPEETRFPVHPLRFGFVVLRDLIGLWPNGLLFLGRFIWNYPGQSRRGLVPIALIHGAAAASAYGLGALHFYLLLWLLPMYTVFPATFRVRTMTEHHGIEEAGHRRYAREAPDTLRTTRSIRTGLLDRLLLGPHGAHYHLEHHLYPSVPFHNLRRLSATLVEADPGAMIPRIRPNYWTAIRECLRSWKCPRKQVESPVKAL